MGAMEEQVHIFPEEKRLYFLRRQSFCEKQQIRDRAFGTLVLYIEYLSLQ